MNEIPTLMLSMCHSPTTIKEIRQHLDEHPLTGNRYQIFDYINVSEPNHYDYEKMSELYEELKAIAAKYQIAFMFSSKKGTTFV
jgi:hypothetical protein